MVRLLCLINYLDHNKVQKVHKKRLSTLDPSRDNLNVTEPIPNGTYPINIIVDKNLLSVNSSVILLPKKSIEKLGINALKTENARSKKSFDFSMPNRSNIAPSQLGTLPI